MTSRYRPRTADGSADIGSPLVWAASWSSSTWRCRALLRRNTRAT